MRSPSDPASGVGIESWSVYLFSNAELFKQELLSKRDSLVKAFKQSKVHLYLLGYEVRTR